MDRAFELSMVDGLLDMMAERSVELTDQVHEEPVANYFDEERFALERDVLFQRTPIAAALSVELPEPGCWKTFDETGIPLILVRGEDGVVRGFHNTCGHRGARLVEEPRGKGRNFSCPFHAWSYNIDGSLRSMSAKKAFAGVCADERALHPVEVREHLGIVWLVTRPSDTPMDLTRHLGPFAAELERWNLPAWDYLDTKVHQVAANWKITMDTFTEGYHVPVLHKDSAGTIVFGNTTLWEPFGDHHRQMFAMRSLKELRDVPREDRQAWDEARILFTYIVYPNITFLIARDHIELFQTYPGRTVNDSLCVHSVFFLEAVESEEDRANASKQFEFFYNLVEYEDFRMSRGIQESLRSGSFRTHVFGRNEPITQAVHRGYQRDLDAAGRPGSANGVALLPAAIAGS